MIQTLLLLAMLNQYQCRIDQNQAKTIVKYALKAEKKHKLPVGLLVAVTLVETGGKSKVFFGRGTDGAGASIGPWQVYCSSSDLSKCLKKYGSIESNAMKAGELLAKSRKVCKGNPLIFCRMKPYGWIALYKGGSFTWYMEVMKVWRGIRLYMSKHTASLDNKIGKYCIK